MPQEKRTGKSSQAERLKRFRLHTASEWKQVAAMIGLSESMIYQVLRGSRVMSDKHLFLLEQAEAEFSIPSKAPAPQTAQTAQEGAQLAGSAPRELLRAARESAGLSFSELSVRTNYAAAVLRAVEEGRGSASERMIEALCKALPGLDKESLMAGSDHPSIISETSTEGTFGAKPDIQLEPGKRARFLPILSMAQAGAVDAEHLDSLYEHQGKLAIDISDPRAFAVTVRGMSMEPVISEGNCIIVCPSWSPRSGDTVIAKTTSGDVLIKLYQLSDRGQRVILSSYNPAFPPIEFAKKEIAWIYPVAEIHKKLRQD